MAKRYQFTILYHSRAFTHLRSIERKYHSLIRKTIEDQLHYEPDIETRNRKLVRQPFVFDATWEIRFGPRNRFRVFYETDQTDRVVHVLAIGEKIGNRLFIAGKEITQ